MSNAAIAAEFESVLGAAEARGVDDLWTDALTRRLRVARFERRARESVAFIAASRAKRRVRRAAKRMQGLFRN